MATAEVASHLRNEPGSINIPVANWPATVKSEPADVDAIANKITDNFNKALSSKNNKALVDLFQSDGYWRDHLVSSWELRTLKGHDNILSFLDGGNRLTNIEVDRSSDFRKPQVTNLDAIGEVKGISFFVNFTTTIGSGEGLIRLAESHGQWKIWTIYLALHELTGYEEPLGKRRTQGVQHGGDPNRKNWAERRKADENFEDNEPAVVILGAGQGGLTIAARLKMLKVPALIVDMNKRVGDNWRQRYHQLVLHDPNQYNHLPYMPFPAWWPLFTPKDKIADWFESYAKLMELNVWMQSQITSSSWDEEKRQWTVEIERTKPDGSKETRTLHPRHVIQATGHSGKKNFPQFKGMDTFKGHLLCHSSEFPGARLEGKGKKAIVVGACNSANDICQDYYEKGYDVTMVQRSSTCVVSSKAITEIALAGLFDDSGPPVDDADLFLHSMPSEMLKALQRNVVQLQAKHDAETLSGLEKAGFNLDKGPDDGGLFIKYLQRGGGYYIDVGASQLIIDGKIKMKSGLEIVEVLPQGLKFEDDSILEADEIIFATGYQNMRSQARTIFGDEVADRVGDIWGFDSEGEMRTIWRKSGHPGFWFHGGNLALCRYYSRPLGLLIKAIEVGICRWEDER